MTGGDVDLTDLWQRTLVALERTGVSPSERAFVGFARLMAVVEQTALIAVPNDYTKKVLESDVREHLVATLSGALGRDIGLAVTVDPTLEHATPSSNGVDPANGFDTANGDERHESPDAARMERFHPEGAGGIPLG